MSTKDQVIEYCGVEPENYNIFLNEIYDDFLIGYTTICGNFFPAYNFNEVIEKLRNDLNLSEQEAITYFNTEILEKKPDLAFVRFTEDYDEIYNYNEGMLIMDEYSTALVGVKIQKDQEIVAVYDEIKCIEILCENMDDEDAREYFDYNVAGAYVGEFTPAILNYLDE